MEFVYPLLTEASYMPDPASAGIQGKRCQLLSLAGTWKIQLRCTSMPRCPG